MLECNSKFVGGDFVVSNWLYKYTERVGSKNDSKGFKSCFFFLFSFFFDLKVEIRVVVVVLLKGPLVKPC